MVDVMIYHDTIQTYHDNIGRKMAPGKNRILKALAGRQTPMYGTALLAKVSKKKLMPIGTFGAYLGALINSGYVRAKRCQKEGKNKLYTITSKGLAAIDK